MKSSKRRKAAVKRTTNPEPCIPNAEAPLEKPQIEKEAGQAQSAVVESQFKLDVDGRHLTMVNKGDTVQLEVHLGHSVACVDLKKMAIVLVKYLKAESFLKPESTCQVNFPGVTATVVL